MMTRMMTKETIRWKRSCGTESGIGMQKGLRRTEGGCGMRMRRRAVITEAKKRQMWYPGATPPEYLDGSMPGDFGFDPLRLGESGPLAYYREAEIMNGRWAMTATLGCFVTESLGLPVWYEAGASTYPLDFNTLIVLQLIIMGVLEYKRFEGWKKTGTSGFLSMYPFDPLNYGSPEFAKAEVMNGRIAMLAFAGFIGQAGVQGKGPVACLADHIKDPGHANVYTTGFGPLFIGIISFLCFWPMIVEAKKAIGVEEDSFFTPASLDD